MMLQLNNKIPIPVVLRSLWRPKNSLKRQGIVKESPESTIGIMCRINWEWGREIFKGKAMQNEYKAMSVDELWSLREEIDLILCSKISEEKAQLEERLRQIKGAASYRNPARPSETWAGRGRQPRWLKAQLESGKKLDDFRIRLF
jgi:DNA-binding protein H-NS